MADRAPGQGAYEAYKLARQARYPQRRYGLWDDLDRYERAAWEAAAAAVAAAERERLYAELGNDHYLILTEDSWTTLHSVQCRLSGRMSECDYHEAVRRIADDEIGPGMLGRWRITGITEGLPDLERAEAPTDD